MPKEGASPDPDELMALVKEKKGSVLTPKTVDIATEIPLTAVGKPDKKALRARYWDDATRQVN